MNYRVLFAELIYSKLKIGIINSRVEDDIADNEDYDDDDDSDYLDDDNSDLDDDPIMDYFTEIENENS